MTPASTAAIVIAAISAALSLFSAAWTESLRRRSGRQAQALQHEYDEKLTTLKDTLSRNREAQSRAEEARRLVAKYRDPLLQSAFDLQSRIYNVLQTGFTGRRQPDYLRLNTLFLIGQFLGWLEIIRREMQFLDLGRVGATKELIEKIERVQDILASTWEYRDEYYVYRGDQRAIGELMTSRLEASATNGPRSECIGYAAFVAKQQEPKFAEWFQRLGDAIQELPGKRPARLVAIQQALIDIIDFLDPDRQRFVGRRSQLSKES